MRIKSRTASGGLALVCLVALAACGAGSSVQLSDLKRDISDLRAANAQQSARLDQLKEDLGRLTGRLDELQHTAVGRTSELEKKLQRFGSRVPPPDGVPADLLNQDDERIATITGPASDLFRASLEQLRGGEFENSERGFQTFIDQNPQTAFTDNAYFWLGVNFEKLGQYDRAIVAYSNVFQKFPVEDRAAAGMFYLSEVFLKIGSQSDALLTFQKLMDDYPQSEFAARAKSRMQELKKAPGRRSGR